LQTPGKSLLIKVCLPLADRFSTRKTRTKTVLFSRCWLLHRQPVPKKPMRLNQKSHRCQNRQSLFLPTVATIAMPLGRGSSGTMKVAEDESCRTVRRFLCAENKRGKTVEPFNEWFKTLFELDQRVWHRGLENNQTQMLAGIFVYQLLVRINYRKGNKNARIRWILDIL